MATLNVRSSKAVEEAVGACVEFAFKNGERLTRSDPSRVTYLRISSFPFCSRQWFLNQPLAKSRWRQDDTRTAYYTSVGTTVHEVFQSAVETIPSMRDDAIAYPWGATPVQDWKCTQCKMRHEFQPYPDQCKWCGNTHFRGLEHAVRYSKHVLGHMDGTFAFPTSATYSKSWIHIPIDYKTASANAIQGSNLPYTGNKDQLLTYSAIKRAEGYNVPGCVLIYVCRDNPNNRRNIYLPLDLDDQLGRIAVYEERYVAAQQARTMKDAIALPTRVDSDFNKHCDHCKYEKVCTKAQAGDLEQLRMFAQKSIQWLSKAEKRNHPNV